MVWLTGVQFMQSTFQHNMGLDFRGLTNSESPIFLTLHHVVKLVTSLADTPLKVKDMILKFRLSNSFILFSEVTEDLFSLLGESCAILIEIKELSITKYSFL